MFKINISPAVEHDLVSIKEYIAVELENLPAAENVIKMIVKQIQLLSDFSELGKKLSSVVGFETPYRYLVCGTYLIFYRKGETAIYIDRVLNGKRDYLKVLFEELNDKKEAEQ